jgi:hypothetical protein
MRLPSEHTQSVPLAATATTQLAYATVLPVTKGEGVVAHRVPTSAVVTANAC